MQDKLIYATLTSLVVFLSSSRVFCREHEVTVSELLVIKIRATQKSAPPDWAILERHLIDTMNKAAPEFLSKYADRGGRMPMIGKPDDMYEVFLNWPLFYALGGSEELLDLSLQQWNAITRELEAAGKLKREFVVHFDWFHNSESYKYFYYLGLAEPSIPENIARAKRFAGMYIGEDPIAPNYDAIHKTMRSPLTGSTGPSFEQDATYLLNHGHASLYPIVKTLEPGWERDPEKSSKIQNLYNRMVLRGDTPISLSSTALVANAYLYTADDKYQTWILEYVKAWQERIKKNKGIIPDNIGWNGEIGEEREGQWWGGLFGWNARYSLHMILGAVTTASEVACLITGDLDYLGLLRSQLDVLFQNSQRVGEQILFPYRFGPQGWFDYRPLEVRELSHLWNASMDSQDWRRIENLLAGYQCGPRPYDNYNDYAMPVDGHNTYHWKSDGTKMDWSQVVSNGDIGDKMQEQEELNEAPRLLYLAGKNPDFPRKILEANYREVLRRLQVSRGVQDIFKVPDLHSEFLAGLNPVVTQGLVFLTMGGPQAIYNGGLLQVSLRYFDLDRLRPGLPEDVAALVKKIEDDHTLVELVNLSLLETRNLLVQGGAFGEHTFAEINYKEEFGGKSRDRASSEKTVLVNRNVFAVELPPGSAIQLNLKTHRFSNHPSYAFPWHRTMGSTIGAKGR